MASPTIRFKRGLVANLPGFLAGEPGFTTDKYDFYIGSDGSSQNNKFFGSARYWQKETNSTSAVLKLINAGDTGSVNLKTRNDHTGITTYTFPASAPAGSGHFLTADPNGNLSWDSVSASATFTDATLTGVTTFTYLTDGDVNAGIVTANSFYVDGTTVLTTTGGLVTLAGISTIDATTKETLETILSLDPNDFDSLNVSGIGTFGGHLYANDGLDVTGVLNANTGLNVTGVATVSALLNANGGLDVTGHSELDNVNISGVATAATLNVTGNSTLGDDSSDTLSVNATSTFSGPATFTNTLTGTISTATKLQNARNFEITGSFVTASAVSFDGTANVGLAATILPNSIELGTYTTGNYVGDVTAGAGLTKSSSASEGQTVDLAIGAGEGITVNADDVALKNGTNLSNNTVLKWNNTDNQLENSIITDNGSTATVGGGLVVSGDLTVNGTTTQVNTTELAVYDRTITLGIQTGSTPADTSWDLGVLMNYGEAGVAKTAGVIWEYGAKRFQFASNSSNPAVGVNTTTPNISVGAFAPIEIGSLWVTDCAGTSQVISCTGSERFLENITVDAGTW